MEHPSVSDLFIVQCIVDIRHGNICQHMHLLLSNFSCWLCSEVFSLSNNHCVMQFSMTSVEVKILHSSNDSKINNLQYIYISSCIIFRYSSGNFKLQLIL